MNKQINNNTSNEPLKRTFLSIVFSSTFTRNHAPGTAATVTKEILWL